MKYDREFVSRGGCDQGTDMIRHDHVRAQVVPLAIEMEQRLLHNVCNTRLFQPTLAVACRQVPLDLSGEEGLKLA